jgi:tetratricopeptide (TPR) repeat protein
MVMMPGTLTEENEATYDQLISLIENSQDRLALIIVGCDDRGVRDRVVERYEAEAKVAQIRPYRIVLGENLSLRSGLASLAETEADLREGKAAVFTVTGADLLMRVKSDPEMEQSELDAFFGYLQWTREGLREFRYPIVLWVSLRILQEMGRRAPDFWSWRKAVLRFGREDQRLVVARQELPMRLDDIDDEFLPPLEELLEEVEELEKTSPDSQGLPTLYAKLGQVYARRISRGEAKDLVAEQDEVVKCFERAIKGMREQGNKSSLVSIFKQFGKFLDSQSRFIEAIQSYENSLNLAKQLNDVSSEAEIFNNMGNLYHFLGDYRKAIDFHNQSLKKYKKIDNKKCIAAVLDDLGYTYQELEDFHKAIDFHNYAFEINQAIGSRKSIATSLNNLGNVYRSLGEQHKALKFHTQSLKLRQEVGDQRYIASSLNNIGNIYRSLRQYHKAIDFYTRSLDINRVIGERYNEAIALVNMAYAQGGLGNRWLAKQILERAKAIYVELELDHKIEECNNIIYEINQIIPSMPIKAPTIGSSETINKHRSRYKSIPIFGCFFIGFALLLFIAWLLR